jgi:hypothetical protein
MKLSPSKSSRKKTMRVATVFTGAAACTAAYMAAPPAYAAPERPASNNGIPESPYSASVMISGRVSTIQACGYKNIGGGKWECTPIIARSNPELTGRVSGTNWRIVELGSNWRRGLFKLWWNHHGAGSWDECNTNGAYNGQIASHSRVLLFTNGSYTSQGGYLQGPVGFGVPEC